MATTNENLTASIFILPFTNDQDLVASIFISASKPFTIEGTLGAQVAKTFTIGGTIADITDTFTISGTLFDPEQTKTFTISGTIADITDTFTISGEIPELISDFTISGEIALPETEFTITGRFPTGDDPLGTSITLITGWEVAENDPEFYAVWEILESLLEFNTVWEVAEGLVQFNTIWEVPIPSIVLSTVWEINPDTKSFNCKWEIRDTGQTATFSIHGTVRDPYDVLFFFDEACTNQVSDEGYTNPIWGSYIWYEGNPQRDLQLYTKNVGVSNVLKVFLESVLADGSTQTWTKIALTQEGLNSAGQSLDIGSLDVDEIKTFWIRSLVPLATASPQIYRSAFLRAKYIL